MRSRRFLLAWLLLPSMSLPAIASEKTASAIDDVIHAPQFKHAQWGILAVDMDTGSVLYEHEADKLVTPASTTKLFSVAAALTDLGADYRFETPIHRRGDVSDMGVLKGDLILVATGDLTMGGRTTPDGKIAFTDHDHTYASLDSTADLTPPDPLAGLDDLARQVYAAGIRKVDGDILIDDRLFEHSTSTGSGPTQVTPIRINDNVLDFTITPGKVGAPASVTWRPQTKTYVVDVQVDTVPTGVKQQIRIQRLGPGRLSVRGKIAADSKPILLIHEADEAASFARSLLIEALQRANVEVTASALDTNKSANLPARDAYASLPTVACLLSPPFAEAAKLILKVSHNLGASTLPLLVAARHGERTLESGLELQGKILKELGVPTETISFGGGAGGSPADLTTPRATVELLLAMSKRPEFAAYKEALPILGVDGTLATAVGEDSPARGQAQAKTGTYLFANGMNGGFILTSKALAGYLTAKTGKPIAFAVIVNKVHMEKSSERNEIGKTLGKICEILHSGEW